MTREENYRIVINVIKRRLEIMFKAKQGIEVERPQPNFEANEKIDQYYRMCLYKRILGVDNNDGAAHAWHRFLGL